MSNNVHVIGNGKSRLTLNTKKLQGITIGCNAIHRDFITDILCCADERMVVEAQQNIVGGTLVGAAGAGVLAETPSDSN